MGLDRREWGWLESRSGNGGGGRSGTDGNTVGVTGGGSRQRVGRLRSSGSELVGLWVNEDSVDQLLREVITKAHVHF
jgi:hypothetical protein